MEDLIEHLAAKPAPGVHPAEGRIMMIDLKTQQEERVLRAYRNMNQEAREYILGHMEDVAEMSPDKPPPILRLIKGATP